ncbi:MAG: hypothetical protein HKO03_04550 [Acidimicrobiia bacterium]|nr:hypothetical protein [Acidimicrobiia bacterium]
MTFGLLIVAMMATIAAPAGAKNQAERPYKGSEQVIFTLLFDTCGPTGCNFTTVGENGRSTHLGKMTSSSEGFITFAPPCELSDGSIGDGFSTEGTFQFTAANGDQIFGTFENEGCADGDGIIPGRIEGSQEIDGGTGRFAGATGSAITFGDNIGPLSWVGTLTY